MAEATTRDGEPVVLKVATHRRTPDRGARCRRRRPTGYVRPSARHRQTALGVRGAPRERLRRRAAAAVLVARRRATPATRCSAAPAKYGVRSTATGCSPSRRATSPSRCANGRVSRAPRERCDRLAALTGVAPGPIWEWGFVERVSTGLLTLQVGRRRLARDMLTTAEALS